MGGGGSTGETGERRKVKVTRAAKRKGEDATHGRRFILWTARQPASSLCCWLVGPEITHLWVGH